MRPVFRAPQEEHELTPQSLRRDRRTIFRITWDLLASPHGMLGLSVAMGGMGFVYTAALPMIALGMTLLAGTAILHRKTQKHRLERLPLRLPLDAKDMLDYGNPYPGRQKYRKGQGAIFLGNAISGEWSYGREIWASFSDMLTHAMILGGTGAGKTETLVSLSFNDLSVGGGLGYIDAKAAPKLYGQIWVMSRMLGRDDDVRVLNYALGQEKLGKTPFVRSNTIQPFAFGKAEALKEIPLSLMASGGQGNSIFESNAKALMTALMMALVEMRDKGEIYLYPGDIVHYLAPTEFVKLAERKDFSDATQTAIRNFLISMGWKPGVKDSSKWGDFDRQYSYAQNYFLDTFSTMNNTYRHIFSEPLGDINMVDVILQRRIFVALIPSLEKSKKELENLGKITLSVVRLATAVGLGGGEIMGSWRRLIDLGIANARVPFFLKIDEIAAIMIEGFAEIFTQGRGLGISCTVGSQDWAGIQGSTEVTKKEASQIASNTKLKFFMTGDDPTATKQLIKDLAGEMEELRTQGYAVKGLMNYYDNLSAQAQRVDRVDMRDIAQQIEGEWHLFFKGNIIRGQGFHAGAGPLSSEYPLFVHRFLQVFRPEYSELSARYGVMKETLNHWIEMAKNVVIPSYIETPFHKLMDVLNHPGHFADKPRELACAAVYQWLYDPQYVPSTESVDIDNDDQPGDLYYDAEEDEPVFDDHEDDVTNIDDENDLVEGEEAKTDELFASIGENLAGHYAKEDSVQEHISKPIKEPSYPQPPKPQKVSMEAYQQDLMQWLENISKAREKKDAQH